MRGGGGDEYEKEGVQHHAEMQTSASSVVVCSLLWSALTGSLLQNRKETGKWKEQSVMPAVSSVAVSR